MDRLLENKEIFGILAAVIGVVTAIINRKKIVVLRYETSSITNETVTVWKRFKRMFFSILAGLFVVLLAAGFNDPGMTPVFAWLFLIFFIIAGYQFIAMFIMIAMS